MQRIDEPVVGGVLEAIAQVVAQRRIPQIDILAHQRDEAPGILLGQFRRVDAGEPHRSGRRPYRAAGEADEGRFARARMAGDRHGFTAAHGERDVAEDARRLLGATAAIGLVQPGQRHAGEKPAHARAGAGDVGEGLYRHCLPPRIGVAHLLEHQHLIVDHRLGRARRGGHRLEPGIGRVQHRLDAIEPHTGADQRVALADDFAERLAHQADEEQRRHHAADRDLPGRSQQHADAEEQHGDQVEAQPIGDADHGAPVVHAGRQRHRLVGEPGEAALLGSGGARLPHEAHRVAAGGAFDLAGDRRVDLVGRLDGGVDAALGKAHRDERQRHKDEGREEPDIDRSEGNRHGGEPDPAMHRGQRHGGEQRVDHAHVIGQPAVQHAGVDRGVAEQRHAQQLGIKPPRQLPGQAVAEPRAERVGQHFGQRRAAGESGDEAEQRQERDQPGAMQRRIDDASEQQRHADRQAGRQRRAQHDRQHLDPIDRKAEPHHPLEHDGRHSPLAVTIGTRPPGRRNAFLRSGGLRIAHGVRGVLTCSPRLVRPRETARFL